MNSRTDARRQAQLAEELCDAREEKRLGTIAQLFMNH